MNKTFNQGVPKMKVNELITELKKHNQNNEVFINVINDNTQDDIHSIECQTPLHTTVYRVSVMKFEVFQEK